MKRSNLTTRLVIVSLLGCHIPLVEASTYFIDMQGDLIKQYYIETSSLPSRVGKYDGTSPELVRPIFTWGGESKLLMSGCPMTSQLPRQTLEWWTQNYASMIGELTRIINTACPINKRISPSELSRFDSLNIGIVTYTRNPVTWGYEIFTMTWMGHPGEGIPTPVKCIPEITKHINYGMLKPTGTVPPASGSLAVRCDGPSSVKVAVNRDSPLVADGATINFYISKQSGPSDGSGTTVYSITSAMEQLPSLPGSYTWAVPVTVDYN